MAVNIAWGVTAEGNLCMLHAYVTICFHSFDLRMAESTNTGNWKACYSERGGKPRELGFGNTKPLKSLFDPSSVHYLSFLLIKYICKNISLAQQEHKKLLNATKCQGKP